MRIAAVTVGTDEERFRCVSANDERIALAQCIAAFATEQSVDLVLLPAGFLTATAGFGPSRSPKPADGDHRNRRMAITETGHGDHRNRASRSPKTVMAIA